MPLKTVPICPICEADMTYKNIVNIPTNIVVPEIEFEMKKVSLRTSQGDTGRIIVDYEVLYMWKCSKCGFVAFFDKLL